MISWLTPLAASFGQHTNIHSQSKDATVYLLPKGSFYSKLVHPTTNYPTIQHPTNHSLGGEYPILYAKNSLVARELFMFQEGPRYHQAMELLAYDTGDEESDDAWLQVSFCVRRWTCQKSESGLGGRGVSIPNQ